jgi:hypothetical protein
MTSFLRPALSILALLATMPLYAQKPPTAGSEDAKIVADFERRVKQYIDFRERFAGKPLKPTDKPQEIVARQHELTDRIRVARAGAKQGEIFTSQIAEYFRHQIASSLAGPHGTEIVSSLRHGEPVKMELQVNQSYPENVPLQSTPPTLLLNLPELSDGLEYRILNRELVLRDSEANIILDYVAHALPDVTK